MSQGTRVGPIAWLLIWPIRFYQVAISRFTPPTCRYYPCCSSYAIGALRRHGAIKGLLLGGWRLLRCNPWSAGGVDRVPARGRWRWVEADRCGGDRCGGGIDDGIDDVTHGDSVPRPDPVDGAGERAAVGIVINRWNGAAPDGGRAPDAGRAAA